MASENINLIVVTPDVLPLGALASQVVCPTAGAIATFIGTTRDHFEGKRVLRLEYEAYQKMAERELLAIVNTARARGLRGCLTKSEYHRDPSGGAAWSEVTRWNARCGAASRHPARKEEAAERRRPDCARERATSDGCPRRPPGSSCARRGADPYQVTAGRALGR